jgi:hypothetical protein
MLTIVPAVSFFGIIAAARTRGVEADLLAGGLDRLGPAVEPLDVYRPRRGALCPGPGPFAQYRRVRAVEEHAVR